MRLLLLLVVALSRRRQPPPEPVLPEGNDDKAIEAAWKVHEAIQEWIKHAETKASFLLTLQSALFVFFGGVSVSKNNELWLGVVDLGFAVFVYLLGLLVLIFGIICLVMAVIPQLRASKLAAEERFNAIYFGHVRGRDWRDIKALMLDGTMLDQLSRQISVTGNIAWKKHQLIRTSLIFATIGLAMIVSMSVWASLVAI